MNLIEFLKTVKEKCDLLSDEELRSFVYEYARTLKETDRKEFIEKLELTGKGVIFKEDLGEELLKVESKLMQIDEGEKKLRCEFNEDYHYWSYDEDEYIYLDPDHLIDDICEAMDLLHRFIDQQKYEDAYKLGNKIAALNIYVDGEYEGDDLSGINDLYQKDILGREYEAFVNEYLYVTYLCSEPSKRPSLFYEIIEQLGYYDLRLEKVLQMGNEGLGDLNDFIKEWIRYLNAKEGRTVDKLMDEAFEMLEEDEDRRACCMDCAKSHPELYLKYLKQLDDKEKILKTGLYALKAVDEDLLVRSDIALYTGKTAYGLGRYDVCDHVYEEAFKSDTSASSFLRLLLMSDPDRDQIRKIYEDVHKRSLKEHVHYGKRNVMAENAYYTICFFDERFDEIMEKAMDSKEYLGWTYTFMKQGISLFLLLLNDDLKIDKGSMRIACLSVYVQGFIKDYYDGLPNDPEKDEYESFLELFMKWKENVKIDENKQERWIRKIGSLIEGRTEAILRGNHRDYYGECAAYIAAYGKVLSSKGIGSYIEMINRYKDKYPRYRAFKKELESII